MADTLPLCAGSPCPAGCSSAGRWHRCCSDKVGPPAGKGSYRSDLVGQLDGLHIEAAPLIVSQPLLCWGKVQVGLISDLFGQTGQPVPVLGKQLDNLQPVWPGTVITFVLATCRSLIVQTQMLRCSAQSKGFRAQCASSSKQGPWLTHAGGNLQPTICLTAGTAGRH